MGGQVSIDNGIMWIDGKAETTKTAKATDEYDGDDQDEYRR